MYIQYTVCCIPIYKILDILMTDVQSSYVCPGVQHFEPKNKLSQDGTGFPQDTPRPCVKLCKNIRI